VHYEVYIDPRKTQTFGASWFLKNTILGCGVRMGKLLDQTWLEFQGLLAGGVQKWSNHWSNRAVLPVTIFLAFGRDPTVVPTKQNCGIFELLSFD
jgi:hypothetical protein